MRRNRIAAAALLWFTVSIAAAAEAEEKAELDEIAASLESESTPSSTQPRSMEQEKAAQLQSGGFRRGLVPTTF